MSWVPPPPDPGSPPIPPQNPPPSSGEVEKPEQEGEEGKLDTPQSDDL